MSKTTIHIAIPAEVYAALKYSARQRGISSSDVATSILRNGLKNELRALQRALAKTLKEK